MIESISDRKSLIELSDVMVEFYKIMPYNKEEITKEFQLEWVNRWLQLMTNGIGEIFALKQNNKIIGAIGFIMYPSLEDGVMTCSEAFWYVHEKYRGKGLSLLLKLQKYAKSKGAKRLLMIHLENSMPDKLKKLYLRMGFKHIESIYMKEL